ncbi:MAG: TetR/AcrR family transcriptional regulator [Burkholderiales bacterium]|nr:TetR/AcrR family transcriptional regulator [Burkholderiales bacterium]
MSASADTRAPQLPVRRTRADQLESNRAALIRAAAQVIGQEGYAKASVGKITALAGLGQGTFYTYFTSRQELFDILLPELGAEMRMVLNQRIAGASTLIEAEEASYRAFVEYVIAYPGYGRILFEADTLAPAASREHARQSYAQHIERLTRAWEKGELPDYKLEEIPSLSAVLLGLRRYFIRIHMAGYEPAIPLDTFVEVSLRAIRCALSPSVPGGRGRSA